MVLEKDLGAPVWQTFGHEAIRFSGCRMEGLGLALPRKDPSPPQEKPISPRKALKAWPETLEAASARITRQAVKKPPAKAGALKCLALRRPGLTAPTLSTKPQ